jgi:hypothetical protein
MSAGANTSTGSAESADSTDSSVDADPSTNADSAPRGRPTPVAWRPIALVAAIAAAVHLTVVTRYGWHHDEFYYVVCGRHPAFGYVDQPPLAPLLARWADAAGGLFGV